MTTIASILASAAAILGALWAAYQKLFPATPPGKAADQPVADVQAAFNQAAQTPGDTSAIEQEISK